MNKPLVTFAIFSYNQERFIREAVRGALAQTYSPLQVVVSDDCSRDGSFEVMQEEAAAYDGPHQVLLNRNDQNLGIGKHLNRVVELAKGEFIVLAAGDDVSLPTRTEEFVRVWSSGGVSYVYCDHTIIDENGRVDGKYVPAPIASWQEYAQRAPWAVGGASAAYDRAVFDVFGPLPDGGMHEDYVLEFRSALLGRTVHIDKCLVKYRRHDSNASGYSNFGSNLSQLAGYYSAQSRGFSVEYEDWLRSLRLYLSTHPEMKTEVSRAMKSIAARSELYKFKGSAFGSDRTDRLRNFLPVARNVGQLGLGPVAKAGLLGVSPALYYETQRWWHRVLARRKAQW